MKRLLLLSMLLTLRPALAQSPSPPPPDPVVDSYVQLLTEANGRVAALNAKVQSDEKEIADLKKQLDAVKSPPTASKDPPK